MTSIWHTLYVATTMNSKYMCTVCGHYCEFTTVYSVCGHSYELEVHVKMFVATTMNSLQCTLFCVTLLVHTNNSLYCTSQLPISVSCNSV